MHLASSWYRHRVCRGPAERGCLCEAAPHEAPPTQHTGTTREPVDTTIRVTAVTVVLVPPAAVSTVIAMVISETVWSGKPSKLKVEMVTGASSCRTPGRCLSSHREGCVDGGCEQLTAVRGESCWLAGRQEAWVSDRHTCAVNKPRGATAHCEGDSQSGTARQPHPQEFGAPVCTHTGQAGGSGCTKEGRRTQQGLGWGRGQRGEAGVGVLA